MFSKTRRAPRSVAEANAVRPVPGGVAGDLAKYFVTRTVLKRFARVGGIQGMLLSAAATYALDRYLMSRRRR